MLWFVAGVVPAPAGDVHPPAESLLHTPCLTRMRWVLRSVYLRRNESHRPAGRHGGGGSEWRTRLSRSGLPGDCALSRIGGGAPMEERNAKLTTAALSRRVAVGLGTGGV